MVKLDVALDLRSDASGKDPDLHSETLRSFHKILWSKQLPSGFSLELEQDAQRYLVADTPQGPIRLASDTISNSLSSHKAIRSLVETVEFGLIEDVKSIGSTIGARIVFPGEESGGKTLNVLRGFHPLIRDRFDLTLECIRRQFKSELSPLSEVLGRYQGFFEMFANFEGFVDFFFLGDLIERGEIRYFTNRSHYFDKSPYPENAHEYEAYLVNTIEFVKRRNARIAAWSVANEK